MLKSIIAVPQFVLFCLLLITIANNTNALITSNELRRMKNARQLTHNPISRTWSTAITDGAMTMDYLDQKGTLTATTDTKRNHVTKDFKKHQNRSPMTFVSKPMTISTTAIEDHLNQGMEELQNFIMENKQHPQPFSINLDVTNYFMTAYDTLKYNDEYDEVMKDKEMVEKPEDENPFLQFFLNLFLAIVL